MFVSRSFAVPKINIFRDVEQSIDKSPKKPKPTDRVDRFFIQSTTYFAKIIKQQKPVIRIKRNYNKD